MKPRSGEHLFLIGAQSSYTEEVAAISNENGSGSIIRIDNLSEEDSPERNWYGQKRLLNARGAFLLCPTPPGARHEMLHSLTGLELQPSSPIAHPSASIDSTVVLGEGTVINRLVAIGNGVQIGRHVQVNRSASIGHNSTLSSFVTVGPGSILTGHLVVEKGVFIGAGAVVLPGVTVGANSIIGSGAVVLTDVPPFSTVVGNPARVIKLSEQGYKGFSVGPARL